jgi:hypothetical protein
MPRVAERMVVRRRLGKRSEICGFGDRQLVDRLVIVGQRGAGDAVGAEAEENLVEVEFENAVLRIGLLDAEGQDRFLDLALVGLVLGEQEVLRHLLGDRRRALARAGLQIVDHGAEEAGHVDAGMLVEILVLGREEGRLDPVRDRLDRQV